MSQTPWIHYDFACLRLVPRVHRAECVNIGVILFAPTSRYLGARFIENSDALCPQFRQQIHDLQLFERYLRSFEQIVAGYAAAGPIARLTQSQRFHWLSAPRSDIFQPAAIHHGRCRELEACLDQLFAELVACGPSF